MDVDDARTAFKTEFFQQLGFDSDYMLKRIKGAHGNAYKDGYDSDSWDRVCLRLDEALGNVFQGMLVDQALKTVPLYTIDPSKMEQYTQQIARELCNEVKNFEEARNDRTLAFRSMSEEERVERTCEALSITFAAVQEQAQEEYLGQGQGQKKKR
jgi:hypothetical protein